MCVLGSQRPGDRPGQVVDLAHHLVVVATVTPVRVAEVVVVRRHHQVGGLAPLRRTRHPAGHVTAGEPDAQGGTAQFFQRERPWPRCRLERHDLAEVSLIGGSATRTVLSVRVLITGMAGFIGSHVAERLSATADVVGIDDLSTGDPANLEGIDADLIVGSILDTDALAEATDGVDAIVHLAARPSVPRSIVDPVATHYANATGTMNVLEAARANGRNPLVIVASSSSVYGANPELPKHERMTPMPVSPYAASKLATEQYTLAWQHSYGLPTLAFRFFNVFGPRQAPGHAYAAVVPAFLYAALRDEPIIVHGDGLQSRDFTYVGTVSEVIATAIERRISSPEPVNLAFGTRTTLLEVIELMQGQLGRTIEVEHVEPRAGDVRHSQAKNDSLRALFPEVEPRPLDQGLSATAEWMRSYVNSGAG